MRESEVPSSACPLCGAPMYGWVALPGPGAAAVAGHGAEEGGTIVDRCEDCGAGLIRDPRPVDLDAELGALVDSERDVLVAPNRASFQAGIGGGGWAALPEAPGRLLHTKRSLGLLAERSGRPIAEPGSPPVGRGQRWMWQTLLNALTLQPNFLPRARSGELRPRTTGRRAAFALDAVVTALAAPLVALVSFPLELAGSLVGRGGVLEARLDPRA